MKPRPSMEWVDRPAPAAPAPRRLCGDCSHFRAGDLNPAAGMGWCALKDAGKYPGADARCPHWTRSKP